MLKNKSKNLIAILLSVLMSGVIPAAITLADNLVIDGDGLAPVSANMLNFGDVEPGSSTTKIVYLAIRRSGQGTNLVNVFGNAATIAINQVDNPNDLLEVEILDASIKTPENWTQLNNFLYQGDTASYEVILEIPIGATATPSNQIETASLTFVASGTDASGNQLTRTENLNITYTIKPPSTPVDNTNPTATHTLSTEDWTSEDVEITINAVDLGSGMKSITVPGGTVVNGATANHSVTVNGLYTFILEDNAGNTYDYVVEVINIDKANPIITGELISVPSEYGWHKNDVLVRYTFSDTGSGIHDGKSTFDQTVSSEGENQSTSYTVYDKAGNSETAFVTGIDIDKTKPVITSKTIPSPNINGWHNTDVIVQYDFSDALSGINDGESSFQETLSTEGRDFESSYTVYDKAGNSATDKVTGINIDKTGPVITINTPLKATGYKIGEVANIDWTTDDNLSGLDLATSLSGSKTLDTSSIGNKSFTITSTDLAGNTTIETVNYKVIYDFDGFFQPVNMDGLNSAKAGNSIPIKFSLNGDMGLTILDGAPKAYTYHANVADDLSVVDTVTAGQSGLSYDPVTAQYTYVWKTDKGWARSTKQLAVTLNDGTVHYAYFSFK